MSAQRCGGVQPSEPAVKGATAGVLGVFGEADEEVVRELLIGVPAAPNASGTGLPVSRRCCSSWATPSVLIR
jgi:hypothetical protein